jgi:outer membrane protein assembly factor BamB
LQTSVVIALANFTILSAFAAEDGQRHSPRTILTSTSLPGPCFEGAPVEQPVSERGLVQADDLTSALEQKRKTEEGAIGASFLGTWSDVARSAEAALQMAIAGFGADDICLAPFLDEAAAAATAVGDLKRGEDLYRRALTLLADSSRNRRYHVNLIESLAGVLSRAGEDQEAADLTAEAGRLRKELLAADPDYDRYATMNSWIGSSTLEDIFIGPTAGAQVLDDLAKRAGVYDRDFEFQFYELHALGILKDQGLRPERLYRNVQHNYLAALAGLAVVRGDKPLLAELVKAETELIAHIGKTAAAPQERLDQDRERLALMGVLKEQGRLDEVGSVAGAIAAQSLVADYGLATEVHLTRADLALRHDDIATANSELARAETNLDAKIDRSSIFVLEHAVASVRSGALDQAKSRLEPLAEKDVYGADHRARVLRLLAHIAHLQGRTAEAIQAMTRSIDILEADSEGDDNSPINFGINKNTRYLTRSLDEAISMALAEPSNGAVASFAAEAELRIRARQLTMTAGRLRDLGLTPLGADVKMRRLREIRSRLSRELRDLAKEPGARPEWSVLDELLDDEGKQQTDFAAQVSGKRLQATEPSLSSVLAEQPADTAFITFVIYHPFDPVDDALDLPALTEPRFAAAWLYRDSPAKWEDLGPVASIDLAVERLRQALTPKGLPKDCSIDSELLVRSLADDSSWRTAAAELARQLFRGKLAEVASLRHVVIAADGSLNLLPFAVIFAGSDQPPGEGPAIRLIATWRDLVSGSEGPTGGTTIFSNPDFDARAVPNPPTGEGIPAAQPRTSGYHYCHLTGTEQELRHIRTVLPELRVFEGVDANKAALIGVDKPGILHIATHGEFLEPAATGETDSGDTLFRLAAAENPMLRSVLVLAGANAREVGENAFMTALELSNLDLDGTQLAVLSACDTGLGGITAGEGVFGLRRALTAAGAHRMLVSLWKVDDVATAAFMGLFYEALQQGTPVDEALTSAQLGIRKNAKWAHPYYWAGFILSGAPGSLTFTKANLPRAKTEVAVAPNASQVQAWRVTVWKYQTGGRIQGSPALGEHIVVVGSEDGAVHAVDSSTGAARWRFETGGKVYGTPRLVGERVLFGSEDHNVYAVDSANGREIWRAKLSGALTAALAVDGSVAYAATLAGSVHALDITDGHEIWRFDATNDGAVSASPTTSLAPIFATPTFDSEFLYIGDTAGRFYKLHRGNGRPAWTIAADAGIGAQAVLADNVVIVATWSGRLMAIDRTSGTVLWKHDSHYEIDDYQVVRVDNVVIFGTGGYTPVTALDLGTGQMVWEYRQGPKKVWSLVAYGGNLYIGDEGGLWLLNLRLGEEQRLLTSGLVTGPPLFDTGALYVGAWDGTLYALR